MAEKSRGMLFRKRNVLGLALAAGIGLGIYLGQFKGFGLGGSGFFGIGGPGEGTQTTTGTTGETKDVSDPADNSDIAADDAPKSVPKVVRVTIDDHQYFLQGEPTPIALPKLIDLIKKAPGDDDGVRVRIYQKMSARAKTEDELKSALIAADIPDVAVIWMPSNPAK